MHHAIWKSICFNQHLPFFLVPLKEHRPNCKLNLQLDAWEFVRRQVGCIGLSDLSCLANRHECLTYEVTSLKFLHQKLIEQAFQSCSPFQAFSLKFKLWLLNWIAVYWYAGEGSLHSIWIQNDFTRTQLKQRGRWWIISNESSTSLPVHRLHFTKTLQCFNRFCMQCIRQLTSYNALHSSNWTTG